MGKPLSRPDCLRQNPPCVGKGEEEEEDINIEDCYVPQRSIYDTVRLNEQIDSGSKGSLSSRHFSDRTLPYSHRTLDLSTLCSNGALSSSSVFELQGRENNKLDEKMIFDALKLNSDIIRTAGLPKAKYHTERREHRRSWRMLVPPNFADYSNKSELSVSGAVDMSDLAATGQSKYGTNSLTSEEDDSGLCSPPAEREEKQDVLTGEQTQIRSISSVEDIQLLGKFEAISSATSSSEQHIPLLTCRSAPINGHYHVRQQQVSQREVAEQDFLWNFQGKLERGDEHGSQLTSLQKDFLAHAMWLQDSERERNFTLEKKTRRSSFEVNKPVETQDRMIEKDFLHVSPQDRDIYYEDAALSVNDKEFTTYAVLHGAEEHDTIHTDSGEIELSGQVLELDDITCCQNGDSKPPEFDFWTSDTQIEQTLDAVCNGVLSRKVIQSINACFFFLYLNIAFIGFFCNCTMDVYVLIIYSRSSLKYLLNMLLEGRNW
ncbi:uncharacterized protein LOC140708235 [Pogona vitticeps]